MKPHKDAQKPAKPPKKKTLSGWFLSKEEPDKDYIPDLKAQWADMGRGQRVKFILGAFLGAVAFIAALVLVYFILAAIVGWLGLG